MIRWRNFLGPSCLGLAAGGQPSPDQVGDVLVRTNDGKRLGAIRKIGKHHFASAITDRAVPVPLAEDCRPEEGYAVEILDGHDSARSGKGGTQ